MLTRGALSALIGILIMIGTLRLHAAELTVVIEGVDSQQQQNIRTMLGLESLHKKEITHESRLRYLFSKADADIKKALQPFGYYQPKIESQLQTGDDQWVAKFIIDPGPLLHISKLDLQLLGDALNDQVFSDLLADSPVQVGSPLIHNHYETLKKRIRSLAAERGYYRAEFIEHRVEVDLIAYQASIVLHYDSGPRYSIGEIRFSKSPLSEGFLRRYVPFESGEPINSAQLLSLQGVLVDSDYFQRVEVRPLWEQASGAQVPLEVTLDAHERTKYRGGFGYGTDTGARMTLGMTRRWVNKRGHQFNTLLRASQIRNSLAAEYVIPGFRPQQDRYTVNVNLNDEHSDSVDTRSQYLGASWQKQWGGWQQVASLGFQQETFAVGPNTTQSTFLIPRISLSTVSVKDRLNVDNGYRLTLQASGGSAQLLSDTDFLQLRLGAKAVHSVNTKLRLLGRADLGVTFVDTFDKLPVSQRFYAGGDNSVRGYAYQSLGPKDNQGDDLGGQNLLVGSVEMDYRLTDKWGVAAFMDVGNAFKGAEADLHIGVGIGLRWFSPVGPVRFDLATPYDDDERGVRLHLSIGPDL
ncbi:autotransporter assembly complex protein TamA [Neptunomonas concharum]|uniref:Translocation and assembly module subunit TamA n=1 Tax=Neptunomonas concharum TaxID=1031538 RepID=A0A5P1REQ7_9GAMM|nr:autotransporter assembly complex family protein [Neptunomonas concharum]QEQ97745.1 outer membrane protein assembly factor [Neptunomonas concharum]